MANYDSIDLDWTWDGDLQVDKNGDLASNDDDYIRSLESEIQTVVKSESLDWEKHYTVGANLSDFQGQPNTREVGLAIERRVKSKILETRIALAEDIKVRAVPVHIHQLLIIVSINAASSTGNRLSPGEPLVTSVIYDSSENSLFFLPDNTMKVKSEV